MIFLLECWKILCELAPWLLLGMLLSGLLHVLLPKNFIRRKLTGTKGIFAAVGLGVPLPLCSCGVVPAGIGLKNQGASNGAAVGFLISTPQTGIDSILVSASFFGWPFALFKMLTAAITGIVGGWLTDRMTENRARELMPTELPVLNSDGSVSMFDRLWSIWVHGLEIVRSIWIWLVIGILISALIQTAMPASWSTVVGQWGLWPAMLLVLVISLPLYVCATASVPIAAALVHGGFPPAAALVFLMAGPATNITTLGAIQGRFGFRTLLVYLSTIIGGSMLFAWLFDWLLTANVTTTSTHVHDHQTWWSIASAIVLLAMMGYFIVEKIQSRRSVFSQTVPGMAALKIPVAGMTCGNCVGRLEKALRANDHVQSVHVELNPGTATVVGDIDRDEVRIIIEQAGFRVKA
jgi:uncharacterized membrane protein YraQ (UPF0718 family)/copper chaperone CopZ